MYNVSVIIPVYNSEKFLEDTILSVVNQTIGFENIELLLVDDSSTDSSREIINKFSKQYDNIKSIFLDENHGCPGPARNIGIAKATSEYIMFLDNDDQYEKHLCEKLYETIKKTNSDIVDCRFNQIDNISSKSSPKLYDEEIKIITENIGYYENIYIWTKIYKKSIIMNNNIQFISQGVNEDALFCTEYFMNAKKLVSLTEYVGYDHFIHGENLSTVTFEYTMNILKSYYNVLRLLEEHHYDTNKFINTRTAFTIERTIVMKECSLKLIKEVLDELYQFEKSANPDNIHLENPIFNTINKLILNKNTSSASRIIYLLNKVSRNKFLRKIYREYD